MSDAASQDADRTTPRDRLMHAATRLFCRNGITATGIDAIVAEAGTAKTTLYKIFKSKQDLVEAVLETEGVSWRAWFLKAIEAPATPRDKLDAIFPALKKWFGEDDYTGCVFINAVGEHPKDETRIRALTVQHKTFILKHITDLAGAAGAARPDALAHQLGLLMDGAIVAALVTRDPGVADAAGQAAGALLDGACGPAKPKRKRTVVLQSGLQGGAAALAKEDLSVVE
jgi:AcrR family transcriptional regulator